MSHLGANECAGSEFQAFHCFSLDAFESFSLSALKHLLRFGVQVSSLRPQGATCDPQQGTPDGQPNVGKPVGILTAQARKTIVKPPPKSSSYMWNILRWFSTYPPLNGQRWKDA